MKALFVLFFLNLTLVASCQENLSKLDRSELAEKYIELQSRINHLESQQAQIDSGKRRTIYLSLDKPFAHSSDSLGIAEISKAKRQFDKEFHSLDVLSSFLPVYTFDPNKVIGFGYRLHPIHLVESFHTGIDIPTQRGHPVCSTIQGKVSSIQRLKSGLGNYIVVEGNNEVYTLYAHLDSIFVETGDAIIQGEAIGTVGSTGSALRPHLHYEVYYNGIPVNPLFTFFEALDYNQIEMIELKNDTCY